MQTSIAIVTALQVYVSHVLFSSVVIKEAKLSCEEAGKAKQINANDMEERSKTDSHIYFAKIDANDLATMQLFARTSDENEARRKEEKESLQDAQGIREDHSVRRSNSVSKMTQHFKALQEKATATVENNPQRALRLSHGVQRYRERKVQSGERFNTQPVTFEEVREAVLQNQRNAAALGTGGASPNDELEPSKLSLAERVRLFDQKISTAETNNTGSQERLSQRRRPSTRYKTQPITSEEVEVASRVSPFNANYQPQTSVEGKR